MTRRFEGKSVFITGGSAGIGAALSLEFARQGARVALAARRAERLAPVCERIRAAGGEALAVVCDVCDRASLDEAVAQTVATFGGVDVAIANAGFGVSGAFKALDTAAYRRQFETNVFGLIDTAYAVLPSLVQTRGRLALIASVAGYMGSPSTSAYSASKFAVRGLAESLYYELADEGVSVTCISPGFVESDFRMTDNQGVFHAEQLDPVPTWLVVPAEKAAQDIVRAIHRRAPDAVITGHGKILVAASRHFPRLFRFAARQLTRGRLARIEAIKRPPTP